MENLCTGSSAFPLGSVAHRFFLLAHYSLWSLSKCEGAEGFCCCYCFCSCLSMWSFPWVPDIPSYYISTEKARRRVLPFSVPLLSLNSSEPCYALFFHTDPERGTMDFLFFKPLWSCLHSSSALKIFSSPMCLLPSWAGCVLLQWLQKCFSLSLRILSESGWNYIRQNRSVNECLK